MGTVEILVIDEGQFIPARLIHRDFPVSEVRVYCTEYFAIIQPVDALIHPWDLEMSSTVTELSRRL